MPKLRHSFIFTLIIITDCHLIIYVMTITHFFLCHYILPLQCNIPLAVLHRLMLLKMGKIVVRNMSSQFGFINKPLLLHLFGFLLYQRYQRHEIYYGLYPILFF
jgi:hypothetical protein